MKHILRNFIKISKFYFNQISLDLNSKEIIIKNNWHKHIPIGIVLNLVIYLIILLLPNNGLNYLTIFLLSSILTFMVCFLFEILQQGKRIIKEKERIESNKDLLVSVPVIITIILIIKIFKKWQKK